MTRRKHILHIDVETTGGFGGRCIFDVGYIITDAIGNELKRDAFLIREALPFIAADRFWNSRKNDMLVQNLGKREQLPARVAWERLQAAMDGCNVWCAFNSSYEASAFKATANCFNLPELKVPAELDLALAALDILSMREYAKFAMANGLYTESRKSLSSKCEHILAWLGFDSAKHCHLAIEDTETQVALFCLLKKRKRKFPELGKRLMHFHHPAWKRHLRVVK